MTFLCHVHPEKNKVYWCWVGLKNANGEHCTDRSCIKKPQWRDGTLVTNLDGYITNGITVRYESVGTDVEQQNKSYMPLSSTNTCGVLQGTRIVGKDARSCKFRSQFICMSVCTTRPKCPTPPDPNPGQMKRLWDGTPQPDAGKVVRYMIDVCTAPIANAHTAHTLHICTQYKQGMGTLRG